MVTRLQDENIISAEPTVSNRRPTVLVFDSGVGGLSVYNEMRQLLPNLHYLYVFDNVAFPYGEKEDAFIVNRVVEIVTAVTQRYPLALAVIACNTASTISLPALRKCFAFPVVGVVPAIKPAVRLTRNGIVGLLATRATVKRAYTCELVERFARECRVEMLGSAELVNMAEAKLCGHSVNIAELRGILQPWLRMAEPPDTVVLGCTHFPLISEELQMVLPEGTRLVDSGAAIARRTAWLLEHDSPAVHSVDNNVAFCLALLPEVVQLAPFLQRLGFTKLEKLSL
ncbi:glutamate racemase [Enterobacteriaceae bacterium LUAb1]